MPQNSESCYKMSYLRKRHDILRQFQLISLDQYFHNLNRLNHHSYGLNTWEICKLIYFEKELSIAIFSFFIINMKITFYKCGVLVAVLTKETSSSIIICKSILLCYVIVLWWRIIQNIRICWILNNNRRIHLYCKKIKNKFKNSQKWKINKTSEFSGSISFEPRQFFLLLWDENESLKKTRNEDVLFTLFYLFTESCILPSSFVSLERVQSQL